MHNGTLVYQGTDELGASLRGLATAMHLSELSGKRLCVRWFEYESSPAVSVASAPKVGAGNSYAKYQNSASHYGLRGLALITQNVAIKYWRFS